MTAARSLLDTAITEAAFQAAVLDVARTLGWSSYHTHDSRRSNAGWPDLALWRRDQFLLAELKRERGRLSPDQARTVNALRVAGLEVHCWRPSDMDLIVARLR